MTIIYIRGNLLEAAEPVIVHGCNAHGVMGSGVALAIRNKWPSAFNKYRDKYQTNGLSLGEVIFANVEDKWIANAITQQNFGSDGQRYVDYEAVESCLRQVKNFMEVYGYDSLAMPKIGAGLGGGDWTVIENIITKIFEDKQVKIYVL
jgi:O-acetyl-ADP-ribose deacetylase (regulator of RNase III)